MSSSSFPEEFQYLFFFSFPFQLEKVNQHIKMLPSIFEYIKNVQVVFLLHFLYHPSYSLRMLYRFCSKTSTPFKDGCWVASNYSSIANRQSNEEKTTNRRTKNWNGKLFYRVKNLKWTKMKRSAKKGEKERETTTIRLIVIWTTAKEDNSDRWHGKMPRNDYKSTLYYIWNMGGRRRTKNETRSNRKSLLVFVYTSTKHGNVANGWTLLITLSRDSDK